MNANSAQKNCWNGSGSRNKPTNFPPRFRAANSKRVAIARALANDPPLIIADEPTGNLNSKTAALVFDLFRDLVSQGKTVLMVTHDKEFARLVPHKIEIADGRINGSHPS